MLLNYPRGSVEVLKEAERLAQELRDDRSLTAVYRRFAAYHSLKGDMAMGMAYSEKCFDAAERTGDVDAMAVIASGTCPACFHAGDLLGAAEISRRALRLLEEQHREDRIAVGGWTAYSQLSGWCVEASAPLGRFEEAEAVLDKGLKSSLAADDAFGTGWMEYSHCFVSDLKGDGDGLIEHARKAIELFEETGVGIVLGMTWSFLGIGYLFTGDYKKARGGVEKGLKLQRESGVPISTPACLCNLAVVLIALGELGGAMKSAEEALQLSRDYKAKLSECLSYITLGRALGEADPSRIDVAEENIRQGIAMAEEMQFRVMLPVGYLYSGEIFEPAGRGEEALENLKRAEEMYREMGVIPQSYWLARTREALARLGEG
jgi:tetratricopeptide (TPR) repeat protein